eukprot:gnl/Dysnectes_brevis/4064_a5325_687.p1 GENE.gnl/Dysnectes_brevis/4064_a5325_687~~gnl/Dysnectes_brevis/4064_a5325_687.p1  ORF type:complete len:822 (+),score=233.73 gnl/Dysnectes_brevis/4064_a5325_687:61-2526(+)
MSKPKSKFKAHLEAVFDICIKYRKRNISSLILPVVITAYILIVSLSSQLGQSSKSTPVDVMSISPFSKCPSSQIGECIDLVWGPSSDPNAKLLVDKTLDIISASTPDASFTVQNFTTIVELDEFLNGEGKGTASAAIYVLDSGEVPAVRIMTPDSGLTLPSATNAVFAESSQIVLQTAINKAASELQGSTSTINISVLDAQFDSASAGVVSTASFSLSIAFLFGGFNVLTMIAMDRKELRYDLLVLSGIDRPAYIVGNCLAGLLDFALVSVTALGLGIVLGFYVDVMTAATIGVLSLFCYLTYIPCAALISSIFGSMELMMAMYLLFGMILSLIWPALFLIWSDIRDHPYITSVITLVVPCALPGLASVKSGEMQIKYDRFDWGMITDGIEEGKGIPSMVTLALLGIVQTVIFTLLSVYLDQIRPATLECRRDPLYFLPNRNKKARNTKSLTFNGEAPSEARPTPVICCSGVTKVYGSPKNPKTMKTALDDMNLNLHAGQIVGLLGHNSAGKTTMIRVLCGQVAATSGVALVDGYNPMREQADVSSRMAVVLQDNVVFPKFSVQEQLEFLSRVTLWHRDAAHRDAMVSETITKMGLQEHRNKDTKDLSGGLKRRLNIGQTLISDSKVVLLDEPSAGLDVSSRHYLWDVLSSMAADSHRLILLSTHSMDEAESLADRIIIMSKGKIVASGSPMFLKGRFARGYTVTITLTAPMALGDQPVDALTALGGLEDVTPKGDSITFVGMVPFGEQRGIPALLRSLGAHPAISDVGLSTPNLTEVFLSVAGHSTEEAEAADSDGDDVCVLAAEDEYTVNHIDLDGYIK